MEFELFPVACGLATGMIVGLAAPRARLWVGAVLSIVFGVLATVLSGEYAVSWAFLLIDIPLVAVSATAAYFLGHRVRTGRWSAAV